MTPVAEHFSILPGAPSALHGAVTDAPTVLQVGGVEAGFAPLQPVLAALGVVTAQDRDEALALLRDIGRRSRSSISARRPGPVGPTLNWLPWTGSWRSSPRPR